MTKKAYCQNPKCAREYTIYNWADAASYFCTTCGSILGDKKPKTPEPKKPGGK